MLIFVDLFLLSNLCLVCLVLSFFFLLFILVLICLFLLIFFVLFLFFSHACSWFFASEGLYVFNAKEAKIKDFCFDNNRDLWIFVVC